MSDRQRITSSPSRQQRQKHTSKSSLLFAFSLLLILKTIINDAITTTEAFTIIPQTTTAIRPLSSTATTLFAKKKATKKKKSSSSVGLKGFGSSTTTTSSSSSSAPKIDKSPKTLSFYKYMESKDRSSSNLKKVALATFPPANLRGIVALRDIPKGDAILDIPYEAALDLGVENSDPTLPAVTLLQKYCKFLKGEDEDGAYMELLPKFMGSDSLSSTDFFTEEALEALQFPPIVEETLHRRDETQKRFESDILPSIQNFRWENDSKVTAQHLQWAVWLITSRVLTVQTTDTTPPRRIMIPLLDMCNHDRSSSHVLTGRAIPGGRLKILAGKNVKAGEQIYISYGGGMEGNDRFIQDYGFLDVFGEDGGMVGFELVANNLLGSTFGRRQMPGAGKRMSKVDRERTLEALGKTSLEEDETELKQLKGKEAGDEDGDGSLMQLKLALEFRIGIKKALKEMQK